jgi:hypothetical protein
MYSIEKKTKTKKQKHQKKRKNQKHLLPFEAAV